MSVDIKVRGYHLDIYSHVNNGRYLEFLEEGRWDYFDRNRFLERLGHLDLAFVLANININYRRPAYVDETIRVLTRMAKIGNKSAKMAQEVRLVENGQPTLLIADAEITFCLMDQATQKAIMIEGEVRELMESLIEEPVVTS